MQRIASALSLFVVLAVGAVGCDGDSTPADAGPDSGPADAGSPDAGPPDAGPITDLCDPSADPGPFPAPDAWSNAGPGGPTTTFSSDALFTNCALLDGGQRDTTDHHNLVAMFDGYLLMPWAPEFGGGGLSFFAFDEPCSPTMVGTGYSDTMRETHSIGISTRDGAWAVVDQMTALLVEGAGGIQFWDISDPTDPRHEVDLELPGFLYPDAYARVSLSTFWQDPYVYVGGANNGVWIVDASNPRDPRFVAQYTPEPLMRVGQVQALGNLLVVTAAEGPRTILLDISVPDAPEVIAGGDFLAGTADGRTREAYFSSFVNGHVFYANKEGGGGLFVWDVTDPENPVHAGENISDGNGGYVFVQGDYAFVGESRFAAIYDISDLANITEVTRLDLEGDLDTVTPIGNVVVLSVDDDALEDEGSAIAAWQETPDARAPSVSFVWPADGATGLRTTSRFGVGFDELVDIRSAHPGSLRLYRTDAATPDEGRVPVVVSTQETLVNVHPTCALEPNTGYTLEVMAGGVADFNGNTLAESRTLTFETGPE
ncbi:MAG: Ig-like domain-containing protein [Sandaracinaceae bacterium]